MKERTDLFIKNDYIFKLVYKISEILNEAKNISCHFNHLNITTDPPPWYLTLSLNFFEIVLLFLIDKSNGILKLVPKLTA